METVIGALRGTLPLLHRGAGTVRFLAEGGGRSMRQRCDTGCFQEARYRLPPRRLRAPARPWGATATFQWIAGLRGLARTMRCAPVPCTTAALTDSGFPSAANAMSQLASAWVAGMAATGSSPRSARGRRFPVVTRRRRAIQRRASAAADATGASPAAAFRSTRRCTPGRSPARGSQRRRRSRSTAR